MFYFDRETDVGKGVRSLIKYALRRKRFRFEFLKTLLNTKLNLLSKNRNRKKVYLDFNQFLYVDFS